MTDGSHAFRPAEERPVNELLLSSEEPVAHTHACVCAERRCHKTSGMSKASVKTTESSPLACSGSPGASPSLVKVPPSTLALKRESLVLVGELLTVLIAGRLRLCCVLLLQLSKGGLKLLDQNVFFESAREPPPKINRKVVKTIQTRN